MSQYLPDVVHIPAVLLLPNRALSYHKSAQWLLPSHSSSQILPHLLTSLHAGASGAVAYSTWARVQVGAAAFAGGAVGYWLSVVVLALSAAFFLFCVYNVLAGGNPPKVPKVVA
jgi:hypothetical protein